ncbi:aminomethyl-transferring glycine dehydrogenase subunit GcvPA [Chthonomonas calidirosea]|uniref:aminomethyl-transferring glycine dehydrogenase subunit GcvPA n=1 Tax=Chthonomonas calidirosea TaxID=454171 RepID=UPI0006ECBCC7|nr:aminomethyl-transferring glycine dehydrogenase subunit GcvPA [Chthonomonas calidirosea]CEK14119.1 glycine dehydrogenase (decarboxylating) alpha subunit [Chthonomonas calidirosea]
MSYISNTDNERKEMLAAIGVDRIEDLFAPVPEAVRLKRLLNLPGPSDELALLRHCEKMAALNKDISSSLSFLGAGIYDHFRPAIIEVLVERGEFLTSYTPYQPEMSQGMLQVLYEYQTLICALTGMDIANASMYDGATALAEAAMMTTDITNRDEVVVLSTVHPHYRQVLQTYLHWAQFVYKEVAPNLEAISAALSERTACVVLQQPDFLGYVASDIANTIEIVHAVGALAVTIVDPISLGILCTPADVGADIAVGEGQGLGISPGYGGPLLGFFACRKEYTRYLPGRIVGATTDQLGRRGYTMTLRTREQDIRREKATSNICTNQTLLALAATIYLCALGKNGLRQVAELVIRKAHYAREALCSIPDITDPFPGRPFFKEFVIQLPIPAQDVCEKLLEKGIMGGLPLQPYYPELGNALLVCVTETKTRDQIDRYAETLQSVVTEMTAYAK